jgi:hypothetical protein
MKLAGTLADAIEGCLNFILVDAEIIRNEPRYSPTMPRDDDLLAAFHAVEEGPQCVLGFECADLRIRFHLA